MHQDINVELFLDLHDIVYFLLNETDILLLRDPIHIMTYSRLSVKICDNHGMW